ncbi:MAG: hypothetical protein K0S68_540 [Candidatus Saccharibacteria bacterium]|jgi:hypothetical protein|nr:hypothetical protein [Candidatus Saccharibacteria bacterium]
MADKVRTENEERDIREWREWKESDMKHWRAWGSWFSWGSPVGLGIFFIALAIAIWILANL